jgi:hypothetical protein
MIKTVRNNDCGNNNPKLWKSSFGGKNTIILIIALILLATIVTGANSDTGIFDIFGKAPIFAGNLDINVKNAAGHNQSGAKVVLYNSNWKYTPEKTTDTSGNVSWTDIDTGTYGYKVYYGSEFWGGGDAVVNTDATTTINFQKYTPYVYAVAISDINGIAKTMFEPGETVHVNVTLNNPNSVDYDTKATLRINQEKDSPYTFENTTGPIHISAEGYANYEWDWKIPIASGTYYINPLALTNISNNYILTDDAGWKWKFTKTAPTKGYGTWMDKEKNDSYVTAIRNYNSDIERQKCKCLSSNRIIYLFPYTGELKITNLTLSYNPDRTEFYKLRLNELKVYPTIGSPGNLFGLKPDKIVNLAINISAKLNSDSNADGLHLDIEPYDDSLITLVNEIRNRTNKPISVAIGKIHFPPALFRSADFVVLMNYGLSSGPNSTPIEDYSSNATIRSQKFLRNATISRGYAMIGVPAVATKNEWEYKIKGSNQPIPSDYTMEQYLQAALNANDMALNEPDINVNNYVGISIWAIKDHPGETTDNYFVYPYNISDAAWSILKHN